MSISKYSSFTLSEPFDKASRYAPHPIAPYVHLTCPHCQRNFVDVQVSYLKAKKAGLCKAHLSKCPLYECPSGDEEEVPTVSVSNALEVHGKCIAEREVLKSEKSSLEQKLDTMTEQLAASREEAKRGREKMTEEARQGREQMTDAINGVKAQLNRWEGGLVSVMEGEFSFVRPITPATIPLQIRSRDSQLALQFSKTHEATETDKERMAIDISAKDKEIANLLRQNSGLRGNLASLDAKYKKCLSEKEALARRTHMNEKVTRAGADTTRKFVHLKNHSLVIHNDHIKKIETLEAQVDNLKTNKRLEMLGKRPAPVAGGERSAPSKRPASVQRMLG